MAGEKKGGEEKMAIGLKAMFTFLVLMVVSLLVEAVLKNDHRKEVERWYYCAVKVLLLSSVGFLLSVFVVIWTA